jgi:hypothetical protein
MENKIVVYGKCGGFATIATFLGNQWWITLKDEKLEPLYSGGPYDQSDYRYLCEVGELIQMRDLAGMMGCALELHEGDIKEVLACRLKDLNMMGVKFISSAQYLNLEFRVFYNENTKRQGKFSVFCSDIDRDMMLFDVDNFDDAKEALSCAKVYVEFFLKHGVKCNYTLRCTENVLEVLGCETNGMKVKIDTLQTL